MCNNSLIYMATPNPAEVLAGGTLPLSTIVRRRSVSVQSQSDSIVLGTDGYYKLTATITFTATAPAVVSIKAQKNGVDLVGIVGSETITTATTETRTIALSGIVRVYCNDGVATITLVNDSDVSITTSNISIDIEYLD